MQKTACIFEMQAVFMVRFVESVKKSL